LGARRSLIPWIINFLSDRRQLVKFDGATSHWLPVNAGVPQGVILKINKNFKIPIGVNTFHCESNKEFHF
jgi:hypothetical protein